MPFTFAHPAAAVPLRRWLGRFGVLSALAIGSMAPDLPYFVDDRFPGKASHSLFGLFWFCLPAGLLTYAFFHAVLKGPLLALLPAALRSRLTSPISDGSPFRRQMWIPVVISLLCGAMTHKVWDAFTHFDGVGVLAFPMLQTELFKIGNYHVHVYTLLQHGSTIAGFAFLFFWFRRWALKETPNGRSLRFKPYRRWRAAFITGLGAISLVVGLWIGMQSIGGRSGAAALKIFLRTTSIAGSVTLGLTILAYSAAWHLRRLR